MRYLLGTTALVQIAYRRKVSLGLASLPANNDYKLRATVTETARADNQGLAEAARLSVEAFATMRAMGWIDDLTAARLAFKFAGEPLPDTEILEILDRATPIDPTVGRVSIPGKEEKE